jgi:hypothetical protein
MSNYLIGIFAAILIGAILVGTAFAVVNRVSHVPQYNQINAPV